MEILRKHYEKIILSFVLVGLAAAAALLPLKVASVRRELESATQGLGRRPIKPLPALDMSTNMAALKRLLKPPKATFATQGHNIFNPIPWSRKGTDGPLIPQEQFGLNSVSVTKITPLYLKIEFKGARDSGDNVRYDFVITREAATNTAGQKPAPRVVALGGKTDVFTLKSVVGEPDKPTEIVLELVDSKKTVSVSKEQVFTEVAGYAADLRYELENKVFPRQRVGQKVSLSGNTYNIVEIESGSITLEDEKTKKRTSIALKAES